jgi:uncharacterized membrane protein
MNPEFFHVLQDTLDQPYGAVLVVGILVLLPVELAFAYWVYRRRVHPFVVWVILTVASWAGSQMFPENRSQARELVFWAGGISAVVTVVMFYMIGRERRVAEGRAGMRRGADESDDD